MLSFLMGWDCVLELSSVNAQLSHNNSQRAPGPVGYS